MEFRQLQYFIAVAEHGSFNRASERIGIAQPALSRQVAALEKDVGVALLERLPRGIRLTAAGQAFLIRAQQLLADVESARRHALDAQSGKIGRLRLGFNGIAFKNPVVQEALRRFGNERREVELTLNTLTSPEQIERLYKRDLDVGFLYAPPPAHPELRFVEIAPYKMMIAMPRQHPLARRKTLRLGELRDDRFIWLSRTRLPWIHDQLIAECLGKGFSPRIVQDAEDSDTLLSLVSLGLGIGFVHPSQRVPLRGLVYKEIPDLTLVWPLYMAWQPAQLTPVAQSFVDLARQVLHDPAQGRRKRR